MNSIWKNPEFKSMVLKLLAVQLVFSMTVFIFLKATLVSVNEGIVNQNAAIVGHMLSSHPEMEDEITGFVTKGATNDEIKNGKEVLKKYGYENGMDMRVQPILDHIWPGIPLKVSAFAMLYAIPLLMIIRREYVKMFKKVRKISYASERVIEGDFSEILPEGEEGDFAVLGHQFNEMAGRLKMSMERLRQEKVFLKNVISDISHQLKTPLSSLIMFNDLMLMDENMKRDTRGQFLSKSKSQLDRMEWLIISLLKMARLEAGTIEFRKDRVPLRDVVERALSPLGMKASVKNIKLEVNEEGERVEFAGDGEWTAEAMGNILKNCIEHTHDHGNITVNLAESAIFSRIVIRDDGEGIDEKDLPHIFERFYRGSNEVKADSVGIGLSLSKSIIEGQGGTVTVKSTRGKGTEFTMTFLKGVL